MKFFEGDESSIDGAQARFSAWWEVHYLALKLANIAQVGVRSWVFQRNLYPLQNVYVVDWWRKYMKMANMFFLNLGTLDEFPGWWILMRIYKTSWVELTFWLPGLYSACLHATLWCQHYVAPWQICKLRRLSTWAQTIQNWVLVNVGMLAWQGLHDLECPERLQTFAQRTSLF